MSFGLFKRKPRAPSDHEWRGPLDLVPGDRVTYYQQELTLAGVVFLASGKERRCQYHFLDAEDHHAVVAFGAGADPLISLERPLLEDEHPDPDAEIVDHGDTTFRRREEEVVQAFAFGGIPPEKGATANIRVYDDEDELAVLIVEDWDGYIEVRAGEFIHENELVIHRQRDGDDWDVKPPPRIDLRSLNEARRTKQMAQQRIAEDKKQADLAAAREKLAAFDEMDEVIEEPEDVVALSEIVDPSFRFGGEEPLEEPIEEPRPDLGPAFPLEEDAGGPFGNEFGLEDESDPDIEAVPDPYQEYMESEREEDFAATEEEGELPLLEPNPLQRDADTPKNFLTSEATDEFINAGIDDEDETDLV